MLQSKFFFSFFFSLPSSALQNKYWVLVNYLQKSVPIQPKAGQIQFCKIDRSSGRAARGHSPGAATLFLRFAAWMGFPLTDLWPDSQNLAERYLRPGGAVTPYGREQRHEQSWHRITWFNDPSTPSAWGTQKQLSKRLRNLLQNMWKNKIQR